MAQEIKVTMVQDGDIYTVSTGSPTMKDIVMDYSDVGEDARGGNSSILLISAALSCFCGNIRAALAARGVVFRTITAHGTGHKEVNSDGAMRLKSIDIQVAVDLDDQYLPALEHCIRIVKGCLVTSSIMEGINVTHEVSRA